LVYTVGGLRTGKFKNQWPLFVPSVVKHQGREIGCHFRAVVNEVTGDGLSVIHNHPAAHP
jgi:hypothetical protein